METNVTGEYAEIPPPALAWAQFLAIVGIAVAIIAIITVIIIMRKRKPLHPAPESAQTK